MNLYFEKVELDEFQLIISAAMTRVLQENKDLFTNNERGFSDEYLTRKEAAAFLKISTTNLWGLDKTQQLPAKRLNGKVLYLKSDLLNFPNQGSMIPKSKTQES